MHDESDYRELTDYERQLLEMLLSVEFPGVHELRKQFATVQVRTISGYPVGDPSIELKVSDSSVAKVVTRVPVDARAKNEDGEYIEALLHVIDGKMDELEFVNYSQLKEEYPYKMPNIDDFTVEVQEDPK